MRSRLALKGYDDEIVEVVVGELKRTGDLDDEKFTHFWVESRMHLNPVGDVILRYELKQKGVSSAIIEVALEEKAKDYDEYKVASNIARERFEQLRKLDKRKALKRLYDFLTRRGFSYDIVSKIIGEIVQQ